MYQYLDHIIWACSDLEHGCRRFEALTGVQARFGGVHAGGRTHNALVAIAPRTYLEIIAPTAGASDDDQWSRVARSWQEPRVLTFCMRGARSLSTIAAAGQQLGWQDSVVGDNGRTTPEGVALRWQWISPKIERFGTAFPFFIDWLDSPHPAETLSSEGAPSIRLVRFAVGHPAAPELKDTLASLGAEVNVYQNATPEFQTELETPKGRITL